MNTATTAYRHRYAALASIIAAGALAAACTTTSSSGDPTPSNTTNAPTTTAVASSAKPTTTTRRASARPTPSPTHTRTAADGAKAAAIQTVRKYYALMDMVENSPSKPITVLHDVLNPFLYSAEATFVKSARSQGWKLSGQTKLIYVRAAAPTISKGRSTVVVRSCADVSKTKAVDSKGKSIVQRTSNFYAETDTVTNSQFPHGKAIITNSSSKFVKSC